ncbi:nicotinate-nucleotide--dimethylbenzimidazole phosphoribosyltransferase [Actinomadura madurae]|nr:nicotinate-nucleotide--dimethylbenzimidazole phosphoribosyltransferase [Actinomadura madurae]MCP9949689.1 nicotinate-nucleotide--dimethylbenzimidazole phosphoribosyltransferase [Actinomadura madurae]
MSLIEDTIASITPPNEAAMRDARDHQARLTKPPGSLGVLEEVSVRLAGLAGRCPPPLPVPAAVAVFAADHGVHAQGVTPWPREVTAQMVANFLAAAPSSTRSPPRSAPASRWSTSGWPPSWTPPPACSRARSRTAPPT